MPLNPPHGDSRSDAELISSVRSGDPSAWGVLFARHGAAVTAMARYYARDAFSADDLVSEAFERTMKVIRGGGGPDVSFRAYVYTAVRRLAYEQTEKNKKTTVTDDFSAFEMPDEVGDPAVSSFERGIVTDAFAKLPERWQAVLWYLEVEQLTPPEVAPLLGLTANGVSALAYRAREGLRQEYLQLHVSEFPAKPDCEDYRGKLGGYARGSLARRDAAKVESHLETCDDCTAIVAELKDVGHGMRAIIAPLILGAGAAAWLGFGGAAPTASAAAIVAPRRPGSRRSQVAAVVASLAAVGAIALVATLLAATGGAPQAEPAPVYTPNSSEPVTPRPTIKPTATPTPTPSVTPPVPTRPSPNPIPPVQPPPPPTPAITIAMQDLGNLVLGHKGLVGATITSATAGVATNIVVNFALPTGVDWDASRSHFTTGTSGWTCAATVGGATCSISALPGNTTTGLFIPVTVADAADTVTVPSVVISSSNTAGGSAAASSAVAVSGLGLTFFADGQYGVTSSGASFVSCSVAVAGCTDARDRIGDGTTWNNDAWQMQVVDEAGTGFPSSLSTLSIPSGATVSFAGLYWSGLAPPGDTDAQLGSIQLRAPGSSTFTAVTAERVDHATYGATPAYQSFADVTALVQSGGAGQWAASGARVGPLVSGWPSTFAGWSLVVVYQDSSLAAGRVTVFDGFELVNSAPVTFVVAGKPNASAEISVVAWEGDASLTGDQLALDGVVLLRNHPGASLTNAFDSTATGSTWSNTFGVDVGQFVPANLSGARGEVTVSTGGESYFIGVVAVATR